MPSATSGKAIASLVLGLLSLICTFFTGIPAIILGCLGLNDISRSRGRLKGSGMAVVGIVLGGVGSTAVAVALLLPAVQAAREAARRAQCTNNLKQIGLAMHNFHSATNTFPAASIKDKDGKPLLSWRVAILPYIECQSLYQRFHLDEPWDSPNNLPLLDEMPLTYACPSTPKSGPGMTPYQVIVGARTMFTGGKGVRINQVTDGTSNTILVAEAKVQVPWSAPEDAPLNLAIPNSGLGSKHPGGFNALFADGSVSFIKSSISQAILSALCTRDGGEVISSGSY
jgi:prepilin-type processing-associated H-X9-DG protein